ncbi:MAG: restriction endonuclease subunit S [Phocaeicola vulgatus]|nr:restriction endonuclease subunit S [Phocaeicola vulgatus]
MDTKALRQKILDLAIHGKLVPQDPNDEPASVLLERIKAEKERLIKEGKIKRSKKSAKTSDTPHYENVPFKVPEGWVWTTLEETLELVSGQDFPPEKYNVNIAGIPYIIGASNIENEQLVINRWTEFPSVYSHLNDLLVVCKGAGVGKMAINNIGTVHIARQIQAVRSYTNCTNIRYIKNVVKNDIESIVSKANGLIPGLKRELLLSLQIPLPPLAEQQRIVTEIDKWFAIIDQIERDKVDLQATIKQVKSKILDLAIHGKLVPQDPNNEPAIELLKRINPDFTSCDNGHYTQLPNGWQIASMQTLCNLTDGEKQSGIKRINLDVKFLRGEREAKSLLSGKFVTANTLLILVDGENSGEIFRSPIDGYQGSTFKQLRINENMNEEYVLQVINLHRKILRESKVGSAIPHLNKKLFKAIEVPIPPYKEQQKIIKAITKAFMSLDLMMESL